MGSSMPSRIRVSLYGVCLFSFVLGAAMPYPAQQPQYKSPIAPLNPALPDGLPAKGEKLIPMPNASAPGSRSRRASGAPPALTEEQRILHLLNRAGFGPRPGDIERVRSMGIDRYLEEQLHPDELSDELLSRPLQQLNTWQMSVPETVQYFAPPPVRPAPTPTPTPAPAIKPPETLAGKDETPKSEMAAKSEAMAAQDRGEPNPKKPSTQEQPQTPAPVQPPLPAAPAPTPTPAPRRDPQQPLRELQQAKLLRAIFSEKQLQEVMVDFWFNHFNIFAGKDSARWFVTSYERDVIRPHALGKFKDLLQAVAQSPAMLYYLDNFLSQAEVKQADGGTGGRGDGVNNPGATQPPLPVRRAGLNENYARELMELHTLGVDGGYTQKDVIEVARCLTGWTMTPQPNVAFVFRPRIHDKGEKTVLETRIPAGGGIEDGLRVINLLAGHQSTARFISYKLSRRFVADDPPAELVDSVARTFLQTGGDIREVVRTILTSEEFNSPANYRNKIKSPLELAASAIRATGASSDAALPLVQWVGRMGEPLYLCQPPTGYPEDSSRWLSNSTLLERMNFAVALVGDKINGTRIEVSRLIDLEEIRNRDRTIDQLLALIVHSRVSDQTRDQLERVMKETQSKLAQARSDDLTMRKNREQLLSGISALILGSREFQVK